MEASVSQQGKGIKVVFVCDLNLLDKLEKVETSSIDFGDENKPNQHILTQTTNKQVFSVIINDPKELVLVCATFKDNKIASFIFDVSSIMFVNVIISKDPRWSKRK